MSSDKCAVGVGVADIWHGAAGDGVQSRPL
jgi:hypothetical protein